MTVILDLPTIFLTQGVEIGWPGGRLFCGICWGDGGASTEDSEVLRKAPGGGLSDQKTQQDGGIQT